MNVSSIKQSMPRLGSSCWEFPHSLGQKRTLNVSVKVEELA